MKNDIKNILITGSSSGIGLEAAKLLCQDGHNLILPCRNESRAEYLLLKIEEYKNLKCNSSQNIQAPILDLSKIKSVKKFSENLLKSKEKIDILILNAGLQYTGSPSPRWSEDGFELTFAVNQLSHQCLAQILIPSLSKSTKPRIIITSSEVHNPLTPGGKIGKPAYLGNLNGLMSSERFLMLDGSSNFSADKAYKDSKVCNILMGQELSRQISKRNLNISVTAWAPGLVIPKSDSGFFRHSRKYNELGQRLFALAARDLFKITETPEKAGYLLYQLAISSKFYNTKFRYYSNKIIGFASKSFQEEDISNEAKNIDLAKSLWNKSSELLGL